MDLLPADLLPLIVLPLSPRDLCTVRLLTKRLRSFVNSESFCRLYYSTRSSPTLKIEQLPPDVKWRDTVERLPLLLRAAFGIQKCIEMWPKLLDPCLEDGEICRIEVCETIQDDEERYCVSIVPDPDDDTRLQIDRLENGVVKQSIRQLDMDLYHVLLHLLLTGGRSLDLKVPLESTGRRLIHLSLCGYETFWLVPQ